LSSEKNRAEKRPAAVGRHFADDRRGAKDGRAEYVIIDGPPRNYEVARSAIIASDLLLIRRAPPPSKSKMLIRQ
jgi:cellulose biosynthesis protein BcsQ